jgi:predicted nuclease with RNAse H fold
MLFFFSKKQAHFVRQEKNIPEEDWLRRCDLFPLSTNILLPAHIRMFGQMTANGCAWSSDLIPVEVSESNDIV